MMPESQFNSLKRTLAQANAAKEAEPVFSIFGQPSTIQIETTRKVLEHARIVCQVSKMVCWEAVELRRMVQSTYFKAKELRQAATAGYRWRTKQEEGQA
ncbi:MAG: hypothetical protein KJ077_14680 [Anaerolineae bacterium]|nr:hypothetical protein [Anaerolineae bacterium]